MKITTHRFAPLRRLLAGVLAAAVCAGALAGCGPASGSSTSQTSEGPQRYSTIFYDVFDTVTTVIAYCDSQEEFNAQMEALHADLKTYNDLYDIYHDYEGIHNIKTINDNAGAAPVQVDEKIIDMLEEAVEMYQVTDGQTNVALGSVLLLWHEHRDAAEDSPEHATLPAQEELEAAAAHCSIEDVVIDREAGTVYLADPDMRLDVGSCGKGYACEQVAQAAEARGLTSALISVGGNLRAIGEKPGGAQWTGAVEDPWNASAVYDANSAYVSAVYLDGNMAMVTSGDYQRYYEVDGVRYHHLIDPDTLYPATWFNSVTVMCADSGLADCLSTGLFCMSLEDGQALVESLAGVEALWCLSDKTIVTSSGWSDHVMES